ncbi:MAG: exonuclease SbcCD subunit D [Anaerolineae bacterium]|nr:exonuclease SbcCD subunit D [Anaerolineae bacterium]MDW8070099.1 exonuclease SbcCD subunit D [Anaerolineae bacterium]
MRCKFLHLSDVHLGYQQYNLKERFNDFGRAFEYIVQRAIEEQVDFVLLAGDLFHKRSIDPPTLLQAVMPLEMLKEKGIPVLAIEGNHDRPHYQEVISWMDFLTDRGYLIALRPSFESGKAILKEWDGFCGAYVDLRSRRDPKGMVRVYGVPYYGAATKQVIPTLRDALNEMDHRGVDYVIMMLHAGPDDVLPHYLATVPQSVLTPLREFVHYLALGHIHKPYERENWMFNPGSPETCSSEEVAWPERGFYLVEVDTAAQPIHRARRIQNPRRPFVQVPINVELFQELQELYVSIPAKLGEHIRGPDAAQPVVEVVLEGIWPFASERVDVERIRSIVAQQVEPLVVRVTNRTVARGTSDPDGDNLSHAELERRVFQHLFEQDVRYAFHAAQWAQLAIEIKRMVLEESSPQSIVEHLQHYMEEQQLNVSDL